MSISIFIVGTGRSGTHFTARAISGFSNIYDPHNGNEYGHVLMPIAKAAIEHKKYPKKVKVYYEEIKKCTPLNKVFLDQHHPNLFFIEDLKNIFVDAIFIYPDRPIVQIVASMMHHKGVMNWYKFKKNKSFLSVIPVFNTFQNKIPIPNQFLGLTSYDQIDNLPIHLKCAYRAIFHKKKMLELSSKDKSCRFLRYEDLLNNQENTFKDIFSEKELYELGNFSIAEEPKKESLYKYKNLLSQDQVKEINELVDFEIR